MFADIPMPRLGENISIAMQNMTGISKKNQLTRYIYSQAYKRFCFRLEKYSNTYLDLYK